MKPPKKIYWVEDPDGVTWYIHVYFDGGVAHEVYTSRKDSLDSLIKWLQKINE